MLVLSVVYNCIYLWTNVPGRALTYIKTFGRVLDGRNRNCICKLAGELLLDD
jgi:hypothetical protein